MKLKQRTILITGGTSGIGLGLARQLLGRGDTEIVTGRDPDASAALHEAVLFCVTGSLVAGERKRLAMDLRKAPSSWLEVEPGYSAAASRGRQSRTAARNAPSALET